MWGSKFLVEYDGMGNSFYSGELICVNNVVSTACLEFVKSRHTKRKRRIYETALPICRMSTYTKTPFSQDGGFQPS